MPLLAVFTQMFAANIACRHGKLALPRIIDI
jgi:hypothetical protein